MSRACAERPHARAAPTPLQGRVLQPVRRAAPDHAHRGGAHPAPDAGRRARPRPDRGSVASLRLPVRSGRVCGRVRGSGIRRRRTGRRLLRARDPGADAGGQRGWPALHLRRAGRVREGEPMLRRLPHTVHRRLSPAQRGTRVVLADLPAAMSPRPGASRRGTVLLALGAAAGILAAGAGLVGRAGGHSLPPGAVARVNGQLIAAEEYQRVLAGLASDRRNGVDVEMRRQVLERLIDEELLVERGLELGLARRDARVRKDLTAAVIDSVVAESADREPSQAELEAFSAGRPDVLRRPGRLRVRQVWCRAATAADEPTALARAR
ncbi:MAG: hypothetical protein E6J70_16470, partial [Deltaproteobacteria bacterium]